MTNSFFPPCPKAALKIGASEDSHPQYKGLLKVGYTAKDLRERVAEHYPRRRPGEPPLRIMLEESATRNDGTVFTDHDVHPHLCGWDIPNPKSRWFQCAVEVIGAAISLTR